MASLSVSGIVKLTRDAEVRKYKTAAYISFGVAAFRKNVKEGKQDVDYFDVEYYYKNPETQLEKSLTRGTLIYLDRAELRNNKFIGRDGKEKSWIKISVFSFEFIGPKKEEEPKLEIEPLSALGTEISPKSELKVLPDEPPF